MKTFAQTIALMLALALGLGWLGVEQSQRTACHDRQHQYDAQIVYTRYLAREFHATPKQTATGLRDLRQTLGRRPSC